MPDHAHRISLAQFMAAEADRVLSDLVPMAALVDQAVRANNRALMLARLSDCHEVYAKLCACHIKGLLDFAAIELARLGWRPDDHPDADINPDEELPASPPEVPWGAES